LLLIADLHAICSIPDTGLKPANQFFISISASPLTAAP
jgi:hypothetical protein